jgi:hypothetical protein
MRTHEGKTRYMNPIYQPQHAVAEGEEPGFTYGVLPRFITFRELPGKHKDGKPFRYHGFSDILRKFFDRIHTADLVDRERLKETERRRREESALYDTVSMIPVSGRPGRHRLREANQWPTMPQTLMAEASH